MPNYYLHTEPDANGNFCLHVANCNHITNTKQLALLGNFEKLEDVIAESKTSDYSISLCKDCIDHNYSKPISNKESLLLNLMKWLRLKSK